jgi:hypothetical protein
LYLVSTIPCESTSYLPRIITCENLHLGLHPLWSNSLEPTTLIKCDKCIIGNKGYIPTRCMCGAGREKSANSGAAKLILASYILHLITVISRTGRGGVGWICGYGRVLPTPNNYSWRNILFFFFQKTSRYFFIFIFYFCKSPYLSLKLVIPPNCQCLLRPITRQK